jgi:hypothetical protein
LPPDGARAARVRISRTVASGTGVGRNARQLNRDATASQTSMGGLSRNPPQCAGIGEWTKERRRTREQPLSAAKSGAALPNLDGPPRVSLALNPGYEHLTS